MLTSRASLRLLGRSVAAFSQQPPPLNDRRDALVFQREDLAGNATGLGKRACEGAWGGAAGACETMSVAGWMGSASNLGINGGGCGDYQYGLVEGKRCTHPGIGSGSPIPGVPMLSTAPTPPSTASTNPSRMFLLDSSLSVGASAT